ncbi:MAG: SPOR domain-containing protein [Desulfotalea sp.]
MIDEKNTEKIDSSSNGEGLPTNEANNQNENVEEGSFFTLLNDLQEDSAGAEKKRLRSKQSADEPSIFSINKYITGGLLIVLLVISGLMFFGSSEEKQVDVAKPAADALESGELDVFSLPVDDIDNSEYVGFTEDIIANGVDEQLPTKLNLPVSKNNIKQKVEEQIAEISAQIKTDLEYEIKSTAPITIILDPTADKPVVVSTAKHDSANSLININELATTKSVLNPSESKKFYIVSEVKKKIAKPTKITIVENSSFSLYEQAVISGHRMVKKTGGNFYSLQLMVISAGTAEKMLTEKMFKELDSTTPISVVNSKNNKVTYVFYGLYKSRKEAKAVVNSLADDLASYKPYIISIDNIVGKVNP